MLLNSSVCALALCLIAAASTLSSSAAATERRFAFTYESGVLSPGEAELEPWTTIRAGREHYYGALDNRLELEFGLVPGLQTSLYWNFGTTTQSVLDPESGTRRRVTESELRSVSSEWKYKLSDALADPIGAALYFEATYGPKEVELEGKLIMDKQVQSLLFAINLIGEQEWELSSAETESEQTLAGTVGVGYFVTPSLVLSLEGISSTLLEDGEVESSTIYAGPSLAYLAERYWLVAGAAPQVFAPKAESGDSLDLDHGERFWGRVILGFHL